MAYQGPSYGLSREVKMRIAARYSEEMEKKQKAWIVDITGIELPEDSEMSFHELLKDGIVLCTLAEKLKPGSIKKPFPHTKLLNSFRCMENITCFLEVSEKSFNVPVASLFQTCDLYDASNMTQVQCCIQAFASAALTQGLISECEFAVKLATKNKRNFDEKTMRAGETMVGLQMGSNKGASQAGMSFGTPRQLYDKKYMADGGGPVYSQQGSQQANGSEKSE